MRILADCAKDAESLANLEAAFFLRTSTSQPPLTRNLERTVQDNTKHVLISLHGIRTRGAWQKELQVSCDHAKPRITHRQFDFGWVGAAKLLIPWCRQAKIDWFRDKYTALILTEGLGDQPPSAVAHSFGTYLVARAMERYPEIRFRQLIVCGSIIRRDYDWSARVANRQLVRVLNDYGRRDIWVRIAEFLIRDAGDSGYRGFETARPDILIQSEHPEWRHSDYFYSLNYDANWIPFLLGAQPRPQSKERLRKTNWRFTITMTLMSAIAVVLGALLYLYW